MPLFNCLQDVHIGTEGQQGLSTLAEVHDPPNADQLGNGSARNHTSGDSARVQGTSNAVPRSDAAEGTERVSSSEDKEVQALTKSRYTAQYSLGRHETNKVVSDDAASPLLTPVFATKSRAGV